MTKTYNIERLIELGANRWTKYGKDRLYLRHFINENLDYKIDRYNTGNIRYAELKGEKISNSMANKLFGSFGDAYIDLTTGKIYTNGPKAEEAIELIEELLEQVEKETEEVKEEIEETEEKEEGEEKMTTMQEIKKMTGTELADFLTQGYEGCEDGLFFITEIEGREIRYTMGLDNEGIVAGALRLGLLKEEEIGDPDDLSDEEISELAEIYLKYDEEIDRDAIEFMRDVIIEDLEKELEEIKKWEDDEE